MKNIVLYEDKVECCACGACANVCPKQAIEMKADEAGFLYPEIDNEKCISCGLCLKTCGYKNASERVNDSPLKVFAFSSRDDLLITKSASGGAFAEIAQYYLNNTDSCVYGVVSENRDGGWKVHHTRITSIDELESIQGSKYVQSDIGDTYTLVKKDLANGKQVLFSGTPCQVDGLKSYLGKEYDNLITVDIICHGVPSQKMYLDFLKLREERNQGHIQRFTFRDKSKGQGMISRMDMLSTSGDKKSIVRKGELYSYFYLFLKQHIYRKNCYSCPYAQRNRVSDITLGDYWGFNSLFPNLDVKFGLTDKKGISCLLANSSKGLSVVEAIYDNCNFMESDFSSAAKYNGQLSHPSTLTSIRDELINLYAEKGYTAIEHYYHTHFWKDRIKYSISEVMPMELKRKIRRIIKGAK